MKLPSEVFEQIVFITTSEIEDHMLIFTTPKENLSQLLQSNNKQYKFAVTFLTGYMGHFFATTKNKKVYFTTRNDDDDLSEFIKAPCAHE